MPATHETPQLTVYREGLTNLNGEATRLLSTAQSLTLLPPNLPGSAWQVLPHTSREPDAIVLHLDRGRLRFRSSGLAAALFAALPPQQRALRLCLTAGASGLYRLVAR